MRSVKEDVRKWRELMRETVGPNYLEAMRKMMDEDSPDWQFAELTIWDRNGNVMVKFVILARGGFEGERIWDE